MEEMLKDYMLGEHLLLVGNQGVGKNKITDRFLHLLNLPREYLQLHRCGEGSSTSISVCLAVAHVVSLTNYTSV